VNFCIMPCAAAERGDCIHWCVSACEQYHYAWCKCQVSGHATGERSYARWPLTCQYISTTSV